MTASVWIGGIGLLITFSIFLAHVIFKTGHVTARVEELEKWRSNMRTDMHEISDKMEQVITTVKELATLIAERTTGPTGRRWSDYPTDPPTPRP